MRPRAPSAPANDAWCLTAALTKQASGRALSYLMEASAAQAYSSSTRRMAKIKTPPVALREPELEDFLRSRSDFAFEMRALAALRLLGFQCQHAATYLDPLTEKIRAFDIRAHRRSDFSVLSLAVECKQLSDVAPLLLHRTPREASESHHSVLVRLVDSTGSSPYTRSVSPSETYPPHLPVARQPDQPTMRDDGSWSSSDAATYERWMQAVNGARDLVEASATMNLGSRSVFAALPMLIVPDGTLWIVDYDKNGARTGKPLRVDATSLYLGHEWTSVATGGTLKHALSHLEVCTISGLPHRVQELSGVDGPLARAAELLGPLRDYL